MEYLHKSFAKSFEFLPNLFIWQLMNYSDYHSFQRNWSFETDQEIHSSQRDIENFFGTK